MSATYEMVAALIEEARAESRGATRWPGSRIKQLADALELLNERPRPVDPFAVARAIHAYQFESTGWAELAESVSLASALLDKFTITEKRGSTA